MFIDIFVFSILFVTFAFFIKRTQGLGLLEAYPASTNQQVLKSFGLHIFIIILSILGTVGVLTFIQ